MHPILLPKGARIGIRYLRKRGYGKRKNEAPGELSANRKLAGNGVRQDLASSNGTCGPLGSIAAKSTRLNRKNIFRIAREPPIPDLSAVA